MVLCCQQEEPTTTVYYDYLNMFLITYSVAASYAVDAAVVVIALSSIAYYIWLIGPRKYLLK